MNEEYESPFRLPGELKCNNPEDATRYEHSHAHAGEPGYEYWGKPCPKHSTRLRKARRSWQQWAQWREEYAKPDATEATRQYAMREMLSFVTETNPPDAVHERRAVRTKTWHDIDGRPHSYPAPVKKRPSDAQLTAVAVVAVFLIFCILAILI